MLAGFMALPEVKRFIDAHYVVVNLDVERLNKNLQIPARWGIVDHLAGVPAVLIIDPSDDSLVDREQGVALAHARRTKPQEMADWMTHWVKELFG
jgi:hypothetical protein